MTSPRLIHHSHELIVSSSVATPAIRMVIVGVSSRMGDDSEDDSWVDPVPAIKSSLIDLYGSRPSEKPPRVGQDHREMIQNGWSYEGRQQRDQPMIVTPDMGLIGAWDYYDLVVNVDYRIVACTWDESEDAERFAPVFGELWANLRETLEDRQARRSIPPPEHPPAKEKPVDDDPRARASKPGPTRTV